MSALRVLANHATVYPRYLLVMHALVHLKLSKVLGLIKKSLCIVDLLDKVGKGVCAPQ
jgi:hypothetical protein